MSKPSPSMSELARRETRKDLDDELYWHLGNLRLSLDAEEWLHAASHCENAASALRKLHANEAAQ